LNARRPPLGTPVRIGAARCDRCFRESALTCETFRSVIRAREGGSGIVATGWALIFSHRVEEADVQLTGGYLDASLAAGIATSMRLFERPAGRCGAVHDRFHTLHPFPGTSMSLPVGTDPGEP
jgi:hypothetical protein